MSDNLMALSARASLCAHAYPLQKITLHWEHLLQSYGKTLTPLKTDM